MEHHRIGKSEASRRMGDEIGEGFKKGFQAEPINLKGASKMVRDNMSPSEEFAGKMEDDGERISYDGGALREPSTGKGRYDLISPFATSRLEISSKNEKEELSSEDSVLGIFKAVSSYQMGLDNRDYLAIAARYGLRLMESEVSQDRERRDYITTWLYSYCYDRLAKWYELGSIKYGDRNWEKGIPYSRCIDSCLRHLNRWVMGSRTEDHLAAVVWNLFAIMHFDATMPGKCDDIPKYRGNEDGEYREIG